MNARSQQRLIGQSSPPPAHKPTTIVPQGLYVAASRQDQVKCRDRANEIAAILTPKLGRPYYSREGILLYRNDCRNVLQALAAKQVLTHLTVTSPPYNIGKQYEKPRGLEEYLTWCERWLGDIHTVTMVTGALWLNLGYLEVPGRGKAVPIPYLLWDRTLFYLQQEVVWHYEAGVAARTRFSPRNEKWLFFTKDSAQYTFNLDDVRDPNVKYPNQKKNGKYRCNPLGKNPGDVWSFAKVTTGKNRSSKERTSHPAQFPLRVIDRIIKVSSNPLDVVLDPFSGSGSAGVAAVGNGRVFIGVELREDYCDIAATRFEQFLSHQGDARRQRNLFDDR